MIRNESCAGAPEDEIKITQEMEDAGLSAIKGFELIDAWEGNLSRAELVKTIYLSMEERNPRRPLAPVLLEKCRE
jgi:hypothetical protein